jgi:hypothetical protein
MNSDDRRVLIVAGLGIIATVCISIYVGYSIHGHISKIQDPEERGLIYLAVSVFCHALISSKS